MATNSALRGPCGLLRELRRTPPSAGCGGTDVAVTDGVPSVRTCPGPGRTRGVVRGQAAETCWLSVSMSVNNSSCSEDSVLRSLRAARRARRQRDWYLGVGARPDLVDGLGD